MTAKERELLDALREAWRLLSVCEFDAPEDLAGLDMIEEVLERYKGQEEGITR